MPLQWTEERVAILEQLWRAGQTATAIGAVIGASKNAIIGKVHRLGIPQGGKPKEPRLVKERMLRRAAPLSRDERNCRRREQRRQRKLGLQPNVFVREVDFMIAAPPPLPDMLLLETADLQSTSCRWVIGDPVNDFHAMRYCGVTAPAGHSFCPHHARIVYARPRQRAAANIRPSYR